MFLSMIFCGSRISYWAASAICFDGIFRNFFTIEFGPSAPMTNNDLHFQLFPYTSTLSLFSDILLIITFVRFCFRDWTRKLEYDKSIRKYLLFRKNRGVWCRLCWTKAEGVLKYVERAAVQCKMRRNRRFFYSHSIVAGGFDEISYTTRLIPSTSLIIRREIRSNRSCGR